MPIGSLIPGQPTTVTPDPNPGYYSSFEGPAPDDLIVADHVLAVIQLALNVQKLALGNIGSPESVMKAVTNAVSGSTWFFVLNQGLYLYSETTRSDNGPFWYSAPGMQNIGSWVNVFYIAFMGLSNPPKLIDTIVPHLQTLQVLTIATPDAINYSVVNQGGNWVVINDSTGHYASYDFTNPVLGDLFELNITPLQVTCGSGDTVTLSIRVTQDGVVSNYTLPSTSSTSTTTMTWPQLLYVSNGDQTITIAAEATNVTAHTSNISSSHPVGWGANGTHTLFTIKQSREF